MLQSRTKNPNLGTLCLSITTRVVPKVIVGPDKDHFVIGKDLICDASPFFRAALKGRFREATEGLISLPEENPVTFGRFVFWLHTGLGISVPPHATQEYFRTAVELYALAEKFMVRRLKNDIINILIHIEMRQHRFPPFDVARFATNYIPLSSPLLKLLITYAIRAIDTDVARSILMKTRGRGKMLEEAEPVLTGSCGDEPVLVETDGAKYVAHSDCDWFYDLGAMETRLSQCPTLAAGVMEGLLNRAALSSVPAAEKPCYYHDHSGDPEGKGECYETERKAANGE
ncbi:hypothetical protein FGG08_001116 [Glutinoglossum americanum]|uniref:BTB domain-containing protein n=1 Tax=Glutinoglossum americanum TaxID=1670608 RepID=A0A9P8I7M1_9PEZI|nr:hypothetical protein FGG08_001116 [Glutinoglossum americanum]